MLICFFQIDAKPESTAEGRTASVEKVRGVTGIYAAEREAEGWWAPGGMRYGRHGKMMKLSRREYSRILAAADREQARALSELIMRTHRVRSLRPAQKTLAMIQMREPVSASLFYLGEALCCECMVEVERSTGFSVMMGDDFEKVTAAAVVDAAFAAGVPETEELTKRLLEMDRAQKAARMHRNSEIIKSKVEFSAMGEG